MQGAVVDKARDPNDEGAARFCVAIQFAIDGDLRFLSHRDEARMLTRALVRARWPVAYSQGFNPRPRVVLPLPRSVGTASCCQWAVVELDAPRAVAGLHPSLAAALPAGCHLQRVVALPRRRSPRPQRVLYTVDLEREHTADVAPRIAHLLAAEAMTIERTYGPGKAPRAVDIRPYIENVGLDGGKLRLRLGFVAQRTARPSEVLTALGLPAAEYNHRVRRVEVEWDIELAGPEAPPASTERNDGGQEENRNAQTRQAHRG